MFRDEILRNAEYVLLLSGTVGDVAGDEVIRAAALFSESRRDHAASATFGGRYGGVILAKQAPDDRFERFVGILAIDAIAEQFGDGRANLPKERVRSVYCLRAGAEVDGKITGEERTVVTGFLYFV